MRPFAYSRVRNDAGAYDAALIAGPLSRLDLRNRDVVTARGPKGRVHLALEMPT